MANDEQGIEKREEEPWKSDSGSIRCGGVRDKSDHGKTIMEAARVETSVVARSVFYDLAALIPRNTPMKEHRGKTVTQAMQSVLGKEKPHGAMKLPLLLSFPPLGRCCAQYVTRRHTTILAGKTKNDQTGDEWRRPTRRTERISTDAHCKGPCHTLHSRHVQARRG